MSNFKVAKQEDGRWRYASMVFDTEEEALAHEARWLRARREGAAAKIVAPPPEASAPNTSPAVLALLGLAFVVFGAVLYVYSSSEPKVEKIKENKFGPVDAFFMCKSALKMVSRDPEKAEIPLVENYGGVTEYYFAWGASTRMLRMRNGLGLEVAASASCIVDKATRKITTLSLNGETLI